MPNWCDCELRVEVKDTKNKEQENKGLSELKKFKNFARKGENVLETNNFIPYPKRFKEQTRLAEKHNKKLNELSKEETKSFKMMSDGFNSGGYDWCIKNWGTKWGICDASMEMYHSELEYWFQTAWSPPEPVIRKMSKMFPRLKFVLTYFEGGMGFNGLLVCKGGKVIEEKCGDYFGGRGG